MLELDTKIDWEHENVIFEGVGIFIDAAMSVHVVLDSVICRKRNLTDVIVDQVDKIMRDLIIEKKAHYFEIYKNEFKNFWHFLEGEPDATERQFKIAQATPRLKRLRIRHEKSDRVEFSWNSYDAKKANGDWFWLEFQYFLESNGVTFAAIPAQLHELYFQFAIGAFAENVTLQLYSWHSKDCIEPYQILQIGNGFYLQVSAKTGGFLSVIEADAKAQIEQRLKKMTNCRIAYYDSVWKNIVQEMSRGPSSFGLLLNEVYFVGIAISLPSESFSSDPRVWKSSHVSSLTFEPESAPSALYFEVLTNLAKEALDCLPPDQRFLSQAIIAYDVNELNKLFSDCDSEFGPEYFEARAGLGAQDYLLSVQICPVLETSHLRDFPPQAGISNVPWLKSLIREAALLEGFQIDTDWIRARLNLPVQRSEIRQTIDALIKSKFIVPLEGTDRFTVAKEQLVTGDQVQGSEIGKYYHAFYSASCEIAKGIPQSKFYWSVRRASLDQVLFEKVRDGLIGFSKGMLEKERACEKRNCVLQISSQLIPLKE